MGRPRTALWESDDRGVYVAKTARGYLIVDTRGANRVETQRNDRDEAFRFASALAASDPLHQPEATFFQLAVHYFEHGQPIWDDDSGVALKQSTIDDRKGYIRNHYAFVGHMKLSELPTMVLNQAVERLRQSEHHSKSLQDKVVGIGRAVLTHGLLTGAIGPDRHFPDPVQRVRRRRVDKTDLVTRETRQLPEHREIHQLARVSAERSGAAYMRLFWWLMAYIGFRVGELSALTVDDVWCDDRVRIDVTKKIRKDGTIEPYAKGYKHRTVVVPSLLVRSLLARVEEVRCGGGSLLFPSWTAGPHDPVLYSTLNDHFCAAGAGIGWRVRFTQPAASYTAADGRTRTYRAKPSSIEYTIHDLRAFAATAMYDHGGAGIKIRGMNMSLQAVAKQLGDTPETVKANYLGIIEGNIALLDREVP